MVVKWSGLNGKIKGGTCEGILQLDCSENPFWHAFIIPRPGSQVSKIFEAGKLEQAYRWCVDQIKQHEQRLRQRGNLEGENAEH